jgi:hypothetical protein
LVFRGGRQVVNDERGSFALLEHHLTARHPHQGAGPGGTMCAGRWSQSILLTMLLGGSPVLSADAQVTSAASWQSTPASLLKSDLRAVLAAQARFHASRGTYATTVQQLGIKPQPGVRIEILAAGARGWQAKAVHRDQPGRSCVIFVGRVDGAESPRTDENRDMAGEEGVPLCDRMH